MAYKYVLDNEIEGQYILPYEPKGWDELETILSRQSKWHGIFLATKTEFSFSCGNGLEYIMKIYEEQGLSANIRMTIQEACGTVHTGSDYNSDYNADYGTALTPIEPEWEMVFYGRLDLKSLDETIIHQTSFITLLAEPIDDFAVVNANVDNEYNMFSEDTTLVPVEFNMHGKEILKTALYEQSGGGGFFWHANDDGVMSMVPLVAFTGGDGLPDYITPTGPFFAPYDGSTSADFYVFPIASTITLEYDLFFRFGGGTTGIIDRSNCYLVVNGNIVYDSGDIYDQISIRLHIVGSVTLNVPAGGTLNVQLRWEFQIQTSKQLVYSFGGAHGNVNDPFSWMKLSTGSVIPATTAPAVYAYEVGNEIVRNILGLDGAFESKLLGRTDSAPLTYPTNGDASFTAFMSGLMARNFPVYNTDAEGNVTSTALSFSLSKYLSAINTIWCIGMDVREGRLRVEKRKEFYQDVVLFQIANILEIHRTVATEYIYNSVSAGFEKFDVTIVNGIDEVNTKRDYTTDQTIVNEYDASTSIVCGAYAIEETREQQYLTTQTTQSNYDNEIFMIATRRVIGQMNNAEKNENYADVTGIYSPSTAYNIRFSPTRNIVRHSAFIFPSVKKAVIKSLRISKANGNINLVATQTDLASGAYSSQPLAESIDISLLDPNIGVDGVSPYVAEYYEFTAPLTKSQYKIILANPYGAIEFSGSESNFIGGFIVNLTYNRLSGLSVFKLLKRA